MSWSYGTVDYTSLPTALLPLAKQHMRVDFIDDDETIRHYLAHAIGLLEKFWDWQIFSVPVTWAPELMTGACAESPVRPVASFTAKDEGGTDVSADYELKKGKDNTVPVFLCRKDGGDFPAGLDVALVAGYGTPASLDPAVEAAVLRLASTFYEHRESVTTLSVDQMPFWLNDLLAGLWIPRA
jgi:uncharacterized phiE125 gp8 family phage protein